MTNIDELVSQYTAYLNLEDLCTAKRGYFPSLNISSLAEKTIADAYDKSMLERGDNRRAHRYNFITERIRQEHQTIKGFMVANGIKDTSSVYHAIKGVGRINDRVAIALIMGCKPSELWPNRADLVNSRDDIFYSAKLNGLNGD